MSQKTVFHLTAGVCFVIALALYVAGFAAPGSGWLAACLIAGAAFEALAFLRLAEQPGDLPKQLS